MVSIETVGASGRSSMIMAFLVLSLMMVVPLGSRFGLASDFSPRRHRAGQQKTEVLTSAPPSYGAGFCEGDYVLITRNRPASAAGGVVKYQK